MKPIAELVLPSQEAIKIRLEARKEGDPFAFEIGEYLNYLDFENAKPYLKEGVTEAQWNESRPPFTKEAIIDAMRKYYPFAWEKANDCRGISANRSILHFVAWTWLLGDLEFCQYIEGLFDRDYKHYGKPILEKIGERYGWDWSKLDNGKRVNNEGE